MRTITFNMTDALLSPESFSILSGAGLIQGTEANPIIVHQTEQAVVGEGGVVTTLNKPHQSSSVTDNFIYVMKLDDNGYVASEPYLYKYTGSSDAEIVDSEGHYILTLKGSGDVLANSAATEASDYKPLATVSYSGSKVSSATATTTPFADGDVVLIDYYTDKTSDGVYQIDITPDKFGGAFYLEASTLFRDRATGQDLPAEFIIPNCRIQSNFTFTMASSGDPSTFDFVMDAFPDYTRFNKTEKVLAEIQIISGTGSDDYNRVSTKSLDEENSDGDIVRPDESTSALAGE